MNDIPDDLDSETQVLDRSDPPHDQLRLWLRLLTCTSLVEAEIRTRLRESFDVTLPRFDLMAQLDRAPEGMTLSDLSKRMMVTNGNVTGLVARLVGSGYLERWTSASDRRVQYIRLTPAGRAEFRKMASRHERWIEDMFAGLRKEEIRSVLKLLGKVKESARTAVRRRLGS
ncbi:MarR family winged helix-turn-helix transcriptional regulator [Sphingosinicella rhizophila]|uniref:MarR family transcriptional regulator n=1 Tax=Sphingosinicella rhizophila TaxID=3050082 RepID=A0ABU3Q4L2_9SPHN|nr:MarR family transcriptional regulator [Sphingosinicella sp. GR2756]MDT9598334.1 MarR family transcriptional regulator [Sphingosinicella sp. GR2756]